MVRARRSGKSFHVLSSRAGLPESRWLEPLERRVLLSTFVVTTTADSGDGSLRQAIQFANATPGADTIAFAVAGKGVHSIALLSALPAVTDPLTIDGTTQPGYAGAPLIELNGAGAGPGASGLQFGNPGVQTFSAAGTVKGLIINRFGKNGLAFLQGSGGPSAVQGCYIGTDATGMAAAPNGGNGIVASTDNVTIGGAKAGTRNVISGNRLSGIAVTGAGVKVLGNYIGTNVAGTAAVGNSYDGIDLSAGQCTIGGADAGAGNVISGNGGSGIFIATQQAGMTTIQGNLIGTNASGTAAVGNGASAVAPHRDGITNSAASALIGGFVPAARNIISGNRGAGVSLAAGGRVAGNYIGTDISGNAPMGNGGDGVVSFAGQFALGDPQGGNLISANGHDGVLVLGGACLITKALIGTNAAGAGPLGNAANGIESRGGAISFVSNAPQARTIVSANGGDGILLLPPSGQVAGGLGRITGVFIGVDATGTVPMGNAGNGIEIRTSENVIGGNTLLTDVGRAGNVISANGGDGVLIADFTGLVPTIGTNHLQGNLIGTDAAGDNALGFGNGHDGVAIYNSSNNTVGNNEAFASQANEAIGGNLIAFNRHNGVTVNGPPTSLQGQPLASTGNWIVGNSIHDNAALGIDLGDDGVTPNHVGQITNGPNRFQNFPLLTSAAVTGTQTVVQGTVTGTAGSTFRVEFFANDVPDPSGYGQGQRFLGSVMAMSNTPFTANLPPATAGTFISATATDAQLDTSEFSPDIVAVDRVQPRVTAATFDWQSASPSVSFTFTKDVSGSLSLSALQVQDASGAQVAPTSLSYDYSTNTATFMLGGPLADGNYTATLLGASVTDANGNQVVPNAADGNYSFGFFALAGDINHDGRVDFADLVVLARHYGHSGTFADGDVNHDGQIDLTDLVALARAYGKTVNNR